jgi:Zn-dependent protease with chaperone function
VIYSQLFLFLLAIFAFSVSPKVEAPWLSPLPALALFVGFLAAWTVFCRRQFAGVRTTSAWFRREKHLSILALPLFCALVYGCDLRYYLSFASFGDYVPSLVNICGLAVFFLCLAPIWEAARPSYQRLFAARYTQGAFFWLHCRTLLPIILPWIFLSLATDAVSLLPFSRLQAALASSWGDFFLFFIFILVITIFLPPLARRLWGCLPLPDGPLRQRLVAFCAAQGFHDGLYLWPLFEGRMMTAAVMGVVPGLRFILLTPAIIDSMSEDELHAVLAHELGHVKKRHLLWYVLLLSGFSALMGVLQDPLLYLLLPPDRLENLLIATGITPATLVTAGQSLPLLAAILLFFRFVFGWFMRNFERQADLRVIKVMGDGRALISTFERLADASGGKEQPSWHHFSLDERIQAIAAAESDPLYSVRHDTKVRRALAGYFCAVIICAVLCASLYSETRQDQEYEIAITSGLLKRQTHQESPRKSAPSAPVSPNQVTP